MNHVICGYARRRISPGHQIRPERNIVARVRHDRRLARRAAGSVEPNDLFHRHGNQSERIIVTQVRLSSKRQPIQILERADAVGSNTRFTQFVFVKGNSLRHSIDSRPQTFHLKFFHLAPRQRLYLIPNIGADRFLTHRLRSDSPHSHAIDFNS